MPAQTRILEEIARAGGWISFARYMQLALHEPGVGYYASGAQKFGRGGDFITAPELGDLFGRTLARQLRGSERVLELGAGSGALAEVLVRELDCEYLILETSAELRARQRERLGDRVRHIDRLPERFRGAMLANEVVDAMPVHLVHWTPSGILERGVVAPLAWADRPATGALLEAAKRIEAPAPYVSEVNLAARAWMRSLVEALDAGAIFVIDYGYPRHEYYHPQRDTGTLMCHYRHQAHADPFARPGEEDITAHVDFTALAEAAHEAGAQVLGYTTQAYFLISCGLAVLVSSGDPTMTLSKLKGTSAVHRLIGPSEMGELFKVLGFGKGMNGPVLGFQSARHLQL